MDATNKKTDRLQLVKVVLDEDFWLIGYVIDDAVRVLDVVENGQSAAEITGSWQRLKPITFDYLRANGFSWRIEPYHEALPNHTALDRWPTPQEVLTWDM